MATQVKGPGVSAAPAPERTALRRPEQFKILLIALLCFILVPPFFIAYEPTGLLASFFLSLVLISVLYVFPRRREFRIALVLAAPTLVGRWLVVSHPDPPLMVAVLLCWVCFLALADMVILRQVLGATRVTDDTISGAICGYLLLGVIFAFLYGAVGLLYPGSFLIDGKIAAVPMDSLFYQHEMNTLIYYSFVTQATLGYGDIVPVSAPARMIAVVEAISGQFYVAILIARLVSIRYSRWGEEN
jgi:voltage-gated potassium channel